MDKRYWHYAYWEQFNDKVFGQTFNNEHLSDDGRIHHQVVFYSISDSGYIEYTPEPEDRYYVKLVKGTEFYLLPVKFIDKFPIIPKATINVHLKKSDSQVWKYIQKIDSLSVPSKRTMEFKEFVDTWNPIKHTNLAGWTLMKLIGFSQGVKIGLCGTVGAGKNSNLILRRYMFPKISPKVHKSTPAKFYRTLYYNDYVNIDEITSWMNTEVAQIEDLIAALADETPDLDKFSLDKNRKMELINKINNKSITFTFNPYSADHKYNFIDKFKNPGKILDRYPLLFIDGKIDDVIDRPSPEEAKRGVADNFKEMCDIVSAEAYWRQNYSKHLHNYPRDVLPFKGRWYNNLSGLIDLMDIYCATELEFNVWVDYLYKTIMDYKDSTRPNELKVNYTEEKIDEDYS